MGSVVNLPNTDGADGNKVFPDLTSLCRLKEDGFVYRLVSSTVVPPVFNVGEQVAKVVVHAVRRTQDCNERMGVVLHESKKPSLRRNW